MATVDDDRDEAYHSGLYSLQSEADSSELTKAKVGRRSVSPGTTTEAVKQILGKSRQPNNDSSIWSLKIPTESNMKQHVARNPETPMTQLAGRLTGVDLKQIDSPTGEYDSGVFSSMPSMSYTSLGQDNQMESTIGSPKEAEKMEVEDSGVVSMSTTSKLTEEELSNTISTNSTLPYTSITASIARTHLLQSETRLRSVSPSVPPVGESVEVITDIPSFNMSSSHPGSKRAFDSEEGERWHRKKTPRLSDIDEGMCMYFPCCINAHCYVSSSICVRKMNGC